MNDIGNNMGQENYRCINCGEKMRKDYFYCGANNAFFCKNESCVRYELKSEVYRDSQDGKIKECIQ